MASEDKKKGTAKVSFFCICQKKAVPLHDFLCINMKNILITLLAAAMLTACARKAEQAGEVIYDRSDFVEVTEVIPDAILEIRYYSTYNFVGTRIDGYTRP